MARWRWTAVALAAALGCGGSGPDAGGPPLNPAGSVLWWAQVGSSADETVHPFAAGFDDAGNVLFLVETTWCAGCVGSPHVLSLHGFDLGGLARSFTSWSYGSSLLDPPLDFRMAVAPDGDAFIAVAPSADCGGTACGTPINLGAGPITGPALARVSPLGTLRWQRPLAAAAEGLHADGSGGVLVVAGTVLMASDRGWGTGTTVQRLDEDGNALWTRSYDVARCAADEAGNAVCTGRPPGATQARVEKLAAADGSTVWWRELVSAKSCPVAARGGRVAVVDPSSDLDLLLLDAAGVGQWRVRMRDARGSKISAAFIGMGASGRVFVGDGTTGLCDNSTVAPASVSVSAFETDGTYLRTRALNVQNPAGWTGPSPTLALGGMAVGPHEEVAVPLDFTGMLAVSDSILAAWDVDAVVAVLGD